MSNDIPDWTQEANVVVSSGTITVNSITTPVSIANGTIDVSTASIAVETVGTAALAINPNPVPRFIAEATGSGYETATANLTAPAAIGDIVFLLVTNTVGAAPTSVAANTALIVGASYQWLYLYVEDGTAQTAFNYSTTASANMAVIAARYALGVHQSHAQATASPWTTSVTPTRNPWRYVLGATSVSTVSMPSAPTWPAGFVQRALLQVRPSASWPYIMTAWADLLYGVSGATSVTTTLAAGEVVAVAI